MSTINEPLSTRVGYSKRTTENKHPLAGKKPIPKIAKPVVSKPIKLKPRPIRIYETK